MSQNIRQQLHSSNLENAILELVVEIKHQSDRKGMGVFASNHEIYGALCQECDEYADAIHDRLSDEEKISELLDIATIAIWGIASIRAGGIDW